jgi:hypothetical protein
MVTEQSLLQSTIVYWCKEGKTFVINNGSERQERGISKMLQKYFTRTYTTVVLAGKIRSLFSLVLLDDNYASLRKNLSAYGFKHIVVDEKEA